MTSPLPLLRLRPYLCLLLPLVLALSACSHNDAPAPGTAASVRYAAVARGQIAVEGGLLYLGMPSDGTLASVKVHAGDAVHKGQILATLDPQPARLAIDQAKASLQQMRAQQQLLDDKLAAARQRARRLRQAAKAGAGDGQSADDATSATIELGAERDAAAASVAMAQQKLASANYELGLRTLKAPTDATVVEMSAQPGASVSTASQLFSLLPDTPRIVRAELSEAFVPAVKVGMSAEVSVDADSSNRSMPAHVLRIGEVVGASTLDDDPQKRANDRTVICVLGFDGPQHLRVGQRVLVKFGATPAAATKAP